MKRNKHQAVIDFNTSVICEIVEDNKVVLLKTKTTRIKNDRELDQALKDTFPASDAIAKYL